MPPLNRFSRTCIALAISQGISAHTEAATIEVNSNGDTDGTDAICTLREAVVSANTNPGNTTSGCDSGELGTDTITFANSVIAGDQISLTQALQLYVSEDLIVNGSISEGVDINGMGNSGVFRVSYSSLSLSNLTVTGGSVNSGGGIESYQGVVDLHNVTVSGNTASNVGGGIYSRSSNVSLTNSTVSGNHGFSAGGVIARFESSLNIVISTISENTATSKGGGVYAGIIEATNDNTVSMLNSIVAGNVAPTADEVFFQVGSSYTTGHNLLGEISNNNTAAFSGITPNANDITATSDGSKPTALASILMPLAINGGATETHHLVSGSPAIGAANESQCPDTDQLGKARDEGFFVPIVAANGKAAVVNLGDKCDVGSVEF